jgi:WXG100 family type VII secretion target
MTLFQASSEALQEVADLFRTQADSLDEVFQQFASVAEDMRGNSWIGQGADKFFMEFDDELIPEAEKLMQNLDNTAAGIDKIVQTIEDGIQLILSRAKAPF